MEKRSGPFYFPGLVPARNSDAFSNRNDNIQNLFWGLCDGSVGKAFLAKPDNLNLTPRTYMVQAGSGLQQVVT